MILLFPHNMRMVYKYFRNPDGSISRLTKKELIKWASNTRDHRRVGSSFFPQTKNPLAWVWCRILHQWNDFKFFLKQCQG